MDINFPYIGETCAVTVAILWAFAVILFKKSGERVHPIALNIFKTLFAFVLMFFTMLILRVPFYRPVMARDYLILLVSGILGIGVAETLFFKSLNMLGASLSAIAGCMYSPFVVGLSVMFLGENFSLLQILGGVFIISAIVFIGLRKNIANIAPRDLRIGIVLAILANAAIAVGIVIIKPLLSYTPLAWAIEVRLLGGIIGLAVIVAIYPQRRIMVASLLKSGRWFYTVSSSFLGNYIALMLWVAGMKYTQASTASVLNQSSQIFIFIFAAIFLREKITWQKLIGLIIGVSGLFLVVLGQ